MYWLIEPEMSSSATSGGSLVCGPRYFSSMMRAAGLHACAQRAAQIDAMAVRMRA